MNEISLGPNVSTATPQVATIGEIPAMGILAVLCFAELPFSFLLIISGKTDKN